MDQDPVSHCDAEHTRDRQHHRIEYQRVKLEESEPAYPVGMGRHELQLGPGQSPEENPRQREAPKPRENQEQEDRPHHVQRPHRAELDAGRVLTPVQSVGILEQRQARGRERRGHDGQQHDSPCDLGVAKAFDLAEDRGERVAIFRPQ